MSEVNITVKSHSDPDFKYEFGSNDFELYREMSYNNLSRPTEYTFRVFVDLKPSPILAAKVLSIKYEDLDVTSNLEASFHQVTLTDIGYLRFEFTLDVDKAPKVYPPSKGPTTILYSE